MMIDNEIDKLIEKYDGPTPRYTSYPTAPHFKHHTEQAALNEQLAQIDPEKPVSLYVHIPFCHQLCYYCGCFTKITNSYERVDSYVTHLMEEVRLVSDQISFRPRVSRIHFGGGTPNYLSIQDLEKILSRFSEQFQFTADTEIDMECDPRFLSEEKIVAYANLGISRISLGVQDFDAGVQKAINRVQPYELVKEKVDQLREAGLDQINLDLLIGLPLQTLDTVTETLKKVELIKPARIAAFSYAHVPWIRKHQQLLEQYQRPDARTRFRMVQLLQQFFKASGYEEIGIDHFARSDDALTKAKMEGRLRRNFQGYTDESTETLLGFGLSSISQFRSAYIQNSSDMATYRSTIAEGRIPLQKCYILTEEDKIRRSLIERLMCDLTIQFSDYPEIPVPTESLAPLMDDRLIEMNQHSLTVTERGKPFLRVVAAQFDPYLQTSKQSEQRHARVV